MLLEENNYQKGDINYYKKYIKYKKKYLTCLHNINYQTDSSNILLGGCPKCNIDGCDCQSKIPKHKRNENLATFPSNKKQKFEKTADSRDVSNNSTYTNIVVINAHGYALPNFTDLSTNVTMVKPLPGNDILQDTTYKVFSNLIKINKNKQLINLKMIIIKTIMMVLLQIIIKIKILINMIKHLIT